MRLVSNDDSKAWRKRAKAEEKFEKRAFKADEKFAKRVAKDERKFAQESAKAYERAYRYREARFSPDWMARTDGNRISHRAVLERDRDATDRYLLLVEFDSYAQGMENSSRPEVGEVAAFLAGISDSVPTFRSLDVLREEDL